MLSSHRTANATHIGRGGDYGVRSVYPFLCVGFVCVCASVCLSFCIHVCMRVGGHRTANTVRIGGRDCGERAPPFCACACAVCLTVCIHVCMRVCIRGHVCYHLMVAMLFSVPGPAALEKFSMRPASSAMDGGVVVEGELGRVRVFVCVCVCVSLTVTLWEAT